MSRIPRQAKRDSNEPEIVKALEAQGFSVCRVSGDGAPDLIVGKGPTFLRMVEVKSQTGKETAKQEKFRARWRGPAPIILRSVDDAAKFALLALEGGETCRWTLDADEWNGDSWDTACGEKYLFVEGGLTENSQRFCSNCGKRVMERIPAVVEEPGEPGEEGGERMTNEDFSRRGRHA